MALTFTWARKKLKEDDFGDAASLQLVMQATDGTETKRASVAVSFGGADLKPIDLWTEADIDTWAEQNRADLERELTNAFDNGGA